MGLNLKLLEELYSDYPLSMALLKGMSMTETYAAPVACTLGADDYRERIAWIADINRSWLIDRKRTGHRLELTYRPAGIESVCEMIRREQACCGFLQFTTYDDDDAFRVVVTAPAEAADVLDAVFVSVGANPGTGSACACASPSR